MCSPCGCRVDSAHGRRPQRAGADGRPETSDRTHHTEHVAHAKQPRREREGHGSDHHQQRKMGDELELLGRMVQGCGAVGGTGEGVRVDDDEAIDMVGMREERDGALIPGKEYQQQRSACFPAVSQHRIQLDAAKILKSFGKFVRQASLRKQRGPDVCPIPFENQSSKHRIEVLIR